MSSSLQQVEAILQHAIEQRTFPGCVCVVLENNTHTVIAHGRHTYDAHAPVSTPTTRYDVASITKVMAPMAILAQLIDEDRVTFDSFLHEILPDFNDTPLRKVVQVKHLLTYTVPFAGVHSKDLRVGKTPQEFARALSMLDLVAPPGSSYCYSNVTAYWATLLVEALSLKKLPTLFQERIATPLGLSQATFGVAQNEREIIPPTEVTLERGEVRGVVHDESTEFLARADISMGAAGLFATAGDVATFLQMALRGGVTQSDARLFSEPIVARWTEDMFPEIIAPTPCMWSDDQNSRAQKYGSRVIHKGGFTGCIALGDLDTQKGFVLLSNRTYPTRPNDSSAFVCVWEAIAEILLRR